MNWWNASYLLNRRQFTFENLLYTGHHKWDHKQFPKITGALCTGSLQNACHHQKGCESKAVDIILLQFCKPWHIHSWVLRAFPMFLLYSVGFTHSHLYLSLFNLLHFYHVTLVIFSRKPNFACTFWDSTDITIFPLRIT